MFDIKHDVLFCCYIFNTVRKVYSQRSCIHHYDLTQTLMTLYLGDNEVGDDGTKCLANVLKNNMVK
jgi:hypothetical protein